MMQRASEKERGPVSNCWAVGPTQLFVKTQNGLISKGVNKTYLSQLDLSDDAVHVPLGTALIGRLHLGPE